MLSYSWTGYLQEVLASVSGQVYPRLEVIVVNNKGPRSEQAARITRQFPSVRPIQNPGNLGEPPSHPSTDFIEFLRLRNFFATYLLHAPMSVLPAFLVRYGPMAVARALVSDRRLARLTLKAWSSVLARAPRLLSERDGRPLP